MLDCAVQICSSCKSEIKGTFQNGIKVQKLKVKVIFKILIEFSFKKSTFILVFKVLLICLVTSSSHVM